VAGDTGGAIKGNRIDLCYNSNSECVEFGRQDVVVHIK
jgi:3D (Asp-Asp-Asp) domain-containing protein